MKPMTEPQRIVVERLLSKGWVEPLHYRYCVYLFLPNEPTGRRGCVSRDWRRKPIRVRPAGNVLPLDPWEPGATEEKETPTDAALSG